MRNFNIWLENFRESISTYDYYIDFKKVIRNVNEIKIELNILNALIGSKNIEKDFEDILTRYPETLRCIPILLAVRNNEIYAQDTNGAFLYNFEIQNYSIEQYKIFMRKTGLFNLMEDLVETFIQKAGFIKNKNYFKEIYISEIEEKFSIDLSKISNTGKTEKRFDFLIKTSNRIYVIETNFYSSSGSKLNETARSYKQLALEAREIENLTFVWFTDGKGWMSARNNLEETFDVMQHIYNIKDLEEGIIKEVFE